MRAVPTEIESRFGFSSKIVMFSSSSGRFDALPGFFSGGPGGVLPQKKNRKSRSSTETAGKALRLSILAPPIYFCYLFSFKSFTVPIRRTFF